MGQIFIRIIMQNEIQQVYVSRNGIAAFKCPHCGEIKHASVMKYKGTKRELSVKCICKGKFSIRLDFRKKYRKRLSLPGEYLNLPLGKIWQDMIVENLSMGGVGFKVAGRHSIEEGHELMVRFRLDNPTHSEIEKKVLVRKIDNDFIGCEFISLGAYEKELGFYLFNPTGE